MIHDHLPIALGAM